MSELHTVERMLYTGSLTIGLRWDRDASDLLVMLVGSLTLDDWSQEDTVQNLAACVFAAHSSFCNARCLPVQVLLPDIVHEVESRTEAGRYEVMEGMVELFTAGGVL